jgi:hypothetical protein
MTASALAEQRETLLWQHFHRIRPFSRERQQLRT